MKKVLYIEDDKEQINLYSFAFQKFAPDIEFSGKLDLQNLFPEIQKVNPDFILLDIQMPDGDGVDVLRQLKNNPSTKNMKVGIFSNSAKQNLAQDCLDLGAVAVWEKTEVTPKELVQKIEDILKS